jgi:hypothetical protein
MLNFMLPLSLHMTARGMGDAKGVLEIRGEDQKKLRLDMDAPSVRPTAGGLLRTPRSDSLCEYPSR